MVSACFIKQLQYCHTIFTLHAGKWLTYEELFRDDAFACAGAKPGPCAFGRRWRCDWIGVNPPPLCPPYLLRWHICKSMNLLIKHQWVCLRKRSGVFFVSSSLPLQILEQKEIFLTKHITISHGDIAPVALPVEDGAACAKKRCCRLRRCQINRTRGANGLLTVVINEVFEKTGFSPFCIWTTFPTGLRKAVWKRSLQNTF